MRLEDLIAEHNRILARNPNIRCLTRWGEWMEYAIPITHMRVEQILHTDRAVASPGISYRLVVGTRWNMGVHKTDRTYARIEYKVTGQIWQEFLPERHGRPSMVGLDDLLRRKQPALLELMRLDAEIMGRM